MRLDQQTDFSIKILLFLANSLGRPASLKLVADHLHVSRGYVAKLLAVLVNHDMVEALRGRTGGLRLRRPAGQISVGKVIRVVERTLLPVECMEHDSTCFLSSVCGLPIYIRKAMAAFFSELDAITLADIIEDPVALRSAFNTSSGTVPQSMS